MRPIRTHLGRHRRTGVDRLLAGELGRQELEIAPPALTG
jgi:hypothetical protein